MCVRVIRYLFNDAEKEGKRECVYVYMRESERLREKEVSGVAM